MTDEFTEAPFAHVMQEKLMSSETKLRADKTLMIAALMSIVDADPMTRPPAVREMRDKLRGVVKL